jgi:hypothetical protein
MTLLSICIADRANLETGISFLGDLLIYSSQGIFNFNPSLIGSPKVAEEAPIKTSACVWPEYDLTLTVHLITQM